MSAASPAFEDPRSQFDVRFYLSSRSCSSSSILKPRSYILGSLVFSIGWTAWISMMIFIGELALGLVYAWKKGALDWE